LHYILFATGIALFALSFPTIIAQNEPLLSLPRYMMILFPITLLLARWGKNPRFDAIYRFLTLLAFVCGVALFVSNVWVA
jgi:NADH:ubiquinone oxidoreductase subunit 4 (subunit M)